MCTEKSASRVSWFVTENLIALMALTNGTVPNLRGSGEAVNRGFKKCLFRVELDKIMCLCINIGQGQSGICLKDIVKICLYFQLLLEKKSRFDRIKIRISSEIFSS